MTTAEADAKRRCDGINALDADVHHLIRRAQSKLWTPVPRMLQAAIVHVPQTQLQTLASSTLVFSRQSGFYVARERRDLWNSRPSCWILLSSGADLGLIIPLTTLGLFMAPLSLVISRTIALVSVSLAFILDTIKVALFSRLAIA